MPSGAQLEPAKKIHYMHVDQTQHLQKVKETLDQELICQMQLISKILQHLRISINRMGKEMRSSLKKEEVPGPGAYAQNLGKQAPNWK
jgi:hypothetical protein